MVIKTTRFGQVKFDQEDVITFPEGLLGFTSFRDFIFVDDPSDEIFIWLQSCESEAIAFPVLEPEFFADNYTVELNKNELDVVKLNDVSEARLFCIVTIPEDPPGLCPDRSLVRGCQRICPHIARENAHTKARGEAIRPQTLGNTASARGRAPRTTTAPSERSASEAGDAAAHAQGTPCNAPSSQRTEERTPGGKTSKATGGKTTCKTTSNTR